MPHEFFLLVLAYELAYIEIIYAEILPPRREAVGFVYHESHHMAGQQNLLYCLGAQHLGSDIQQRCVALHHPLYGIGALYWVEQSVDGHGIGNAPFGQFVHLVFHQRLQG